ncbi:unnamed protein product, partial [marine sediment metagenome]
IITNIEDDHLDHYENMENILKDFRKFIDKVPDNGQVILCKDCDNIKGLVKQCGRSHVSYGIFTKADLMAKDIELDKLNSKSKIYAREVLNFKLWFCAFSFSLYALTIYYIRNTNRSGIIFNE